MSRVSAARVDIAPLMFYRRAVNDATLVIYANLKGGEK